MVSSDWIAASLERHGWKKDVAGESDFGLACDGIAEAINTGKGILLVGCAGVGKTALLKALYDFPSTREKSWLYCKDCQHLGWMDNNQSFYLDRNVFVDDIGSEDAQRKFGNVKDVVADFIASYYERGEGRLMATTNLDASAINERYGGRILDRLLDICVTIRFGGKSKREKVVFK